MEQESIRQIAVLSRKNNCNVAMSFAIEKKLLYVTIIILKKNTSLYSCGVEYLNRHMNC